MCGILGCVGNYNAKEIIFEGLKKIEYKEYDSAGIALYNDNHILVRKLNGRISDLENLIEQDDLFSNTGIGHIRWATYGEPSVRNSHPHMDMRGRIAVVHDGIIENYKELKEEPINKHGSVFQSETDTEVLAHLIGIYYKGNNLEDAVSRALQRVYGSYGIAVISSEEPNTIVASRKDSPLVVGLGEQGNFISSDVPPLIKYTRKLIYLENQDLVLLKGNEVKIFDFSHQEVHREVYHVEWKEPVVDDQETVEETEIDNREYHCILPVL